MQEAEETDVKIKLDYRKIDERFQSNKQLQEIEAYLHDDDKCLTFVRKGICAYTFELPNLSDSSSQDRRAKLLFYFE